MQTGNDLFAIVGGNRNTATEISKVNDSDGMKLSDRSVWIRLIQLFEWCLK